MTSQNAVARELRNGESTRCGKRRWSCILVFTVELFGNQIIAEPIRWSITPTTGSSGWGRRNQPKRIRRGRRGQRRRGCVAGRLVGTVPGRLAIEPAVQLRVGGSTHRASTLASSYAEIGDFDNARKWAAKAVELSEDLKDQLQKELDSYKKNEVWRELQETEENPDFEEPSGDVVDT